MANDLVRRVLALFAAVAPDGGEGVLRALRAELGALAPFDDGELTLNLAADLHRCALGERATPLVTAELLAPTGVQEATLRIDDARQPGPLPRTRETLVGHQLRSLLALPIAFGGATRGAIALAARRPCAFAETPVETLRPLADGAGLALKHALKLSGLRDEHEALRLAARAGAATLAERDEALLAARSELAAREAEHQATRHALEQLHRDRDAAGAGRASSRPEVALARTIEPREGATPAIGDGDAGTDRKSPATRPPGAANAKPPADDSAAARHRRR